MTEHETSVKNIGRQEGECLCGTAEDELPRYIVTRMHRDGDGNELAEDIHWFAACVECGVHFCPCGSNHRVGDKVARPYQVAA